MGQIWAGARRGQEKSLASLCLYWKIPFLRLHCWVLERRGHRGTPPIQGGGCWEQGFHSVAIPGGKVTSSKWGFAGWRGAGGTESSCPQMKMMWPYFHGEGWGAVPERTDDEFICPSVRWYFNLYILPSVWLQWTRSPADVNLSSSIKVSRVSFLQLGTASASSGL